MPIECLYGCVEKLVRVVEDYNWLINAYTSDAYVKDYINKLPTSWTETLRKLDPPELAVLLDQNSSDNFDKRHIWPLSLLCYKAATQAFSLPKNPQQSLSQIEEQLKKCKTTTCKRKGNHWETLQNKSDCIDHKGSDLNVSNVASESVLIENGQCRSFDHCYRRHVKPKKQHEIKQLGEVVNLISERLGCRHVVDVGAGQGHLSRVLSFGYDLNVTTVEAAGCHAPKAQKYDSEVVKDMHKRKGRKKKVTLDEVLQKHEEIEALIPTIPNHVISLIQPDILPADFIKIVDSTPFQNPMSPNELCEGNHNQNGFCDEENPVGSLGEHLETPQIDEDTPVDKKFILTGLHACGDLTPTILRVFCQCPLVAAVASVSCCYMKLSIEGQPQPNGGPVGYPMSQYVKSISGHQLSFQAREMACHFIDAYHKRLLENRQELIIHSYRAALQEILHDIDSNINHTSIKLTIKNTHLLPFDRYAALALQKLGIKRTLTSDQLERAQRRIAGWKDVVIFYTLRLMLAPVVESLLLLDRMLFFREQGIQCILVPIFDPRLSPRNLALIAIKD